MYDILFLWVFWYAESISDVTFIPRSNTVAEPQVKVKVDLSVCNK